MSWLAAGLSLMGNVLLIKKWRLGFLCWFVANVYWIAHNLMIREYAQMAMFAVYAVLAVWGWIEWKKKKTSPSA